MTIIFGWQDGADIFLIADSAVTRSTPAIGTSSSFGEAVLEGVLTVEEAAIKIIELPRNVIVGVAGNSTSALDFLQLFSRDLRQTVLPVRTLLAAIVEIFRDRGGERAFQVLVADASGGESALLLVRVPEATVEQSPGGVVAIGSLPAVKTEAGACLVQTIRRLGLTPEDRLAATITLLQATGITDYLPIHGVGGALFGARCGQSGVAWQPDLMYFLYPPRLFADAPIVLEAERPSESIGDGRLAYARSLVRKGAGILLSSLGDPPARVLVPPNSQLSQQDWQKVVLAAVPPPFELVVPSHHYAFLSTAFRKAVVYVNHSGDGTAVGVTGAIGRREIRVHPRVVETLELECTPGCFQFSVIMEDGNDIDARTFELNESSVLT